MRHEAIQIWMLMVSIALCCVPQGHALLTRQAGSTIPCPLVDFDGGFNDVSIPWFIRAYSLLPLACSVTSGSRFSR